MSHPSHRDHLNAIQAKRWQEAVDDDEAARLEALLAADQQRQKELPQYQEKEAREA